MRRLLALTLLLSLAVIACGKVEGEELAEQSCLWTSEDFRVCVRYDQLNQKRLDNVLRICVSTSEQVGTLVESCPTEGRVGACIRDMGGSLPNTGSALHGAIVYYEETGAGTADEIRRGCEKNGGTFEP